MPLIAPDNGGVLNAGGLERLPFQDPNNFVVSPQKILASAQAQGQLGQLSDQLALEKAERQADMASTQYKIAATGYLQNNLPLLSQAQVSDTLAKIASSKSTAAQATNDLAQANAYGASGGPLAAGAAVGQTATNALATANANAPIASQPSYIQAAVAANAQGVGSLLSQWGQLLTPAPAGIQAGSAPLANPPASTTTPVVQPGGYTPGSSVAPGTGALKNVAVPQGAAAPQSSQVPAVSTFGGMQVASVNPELTSMMQGIRQAALIDATTDQHTLEIPNYPNPGETSTVFQRISKSDGSVVSSSAPVVTKNDATRLVQRSAQDIVNLQTSNNLLGGVQTALDKWKDTYPSPSGFFDAVTGGAERQGQAAAAASDPATGKVSLIEKSVGGMAESPETRQLVGAIQVYNQSLIKLDPDTQKGASAIGLSVGDVVTPDQLQTKLNGAKDYAAARLKTFAQDNISQRVDPGSPAEVTSSPTPAPTPTPTPGTFTPKPPVTKYGAVYVNTAPGVWTKQ